ncbi:hypothetical protein [Microbacterium sp.]|uniref:hypothetical protein n=1 Tax=Microbacterium sp. TaxID=51671 RepID=UPI003735F161
MSPLLRLFGVPERSPDRCRPDIPAHRDPGGGSTTNGFDWPGLVLLWGGSALLVAIGTAALARRDILG